MRWIPHPFFFGLYPILFLYSRNTNLDLGMEFLRPALLVTGLLVVAWLVIRALRLGPDKSALLVSLFLILFFSFGHVADAVGMTSVPSKFVLAGWILIFGVAWFLVARSSSDFATATRIANVIGGILLVFPTVSLVGGLATSAGGEALERLEESAPRTLRGGARMPNVYYIVLDAYGRGDKLKAIYEFDNGDFLDDLREMGFYVADRSTANYAQTILSLASSLNFRYLDQIADLEGESDDRTTLMARIRHNEVAAYLRDLGYEFIAFTSGYQGVQMRTADKDMRFYAGLTEFETVLLNSTPLEEIFLKLDWYNGWDVHRDRLNYIFRSLPDTATSPDPAFVFAHVMAPHAPFVFDADGNALDPRDVDPDVGFIFNDGMYPGLDMTLEQYVDGYTGQLAYVNTRLRGVLNKIISDSEVPPIIIVQGDHGPSSSLNSHLSNPNPFNLKERMSILNAYYLPGDAADNLYAEISPVNSFRIVLNNYFGGNFELQEDRALFSTWDEPFRFEDVTGTVTAD